VLPEFAALGQEAVAIDLPGHGERREETATSMLEYRDAVLEAMRPGDVLVGHSAGGWSVTLAAEAAPDEIGHLLYYAAAVPFEGQPAAARKIAPPELHAQTKLTHGGTRSVLATLEAATAHFFHDCDPEAARYGFEHLDPEPIAPLTEPMSVPKFWTSTIPRSYILCTDDRAYPLDYMHDAARRLGVEPILQPCGHFPMISRPRETAELIIATVKNPAAPR
jgi:pimeloyl-ACP methyl ester carboxylesterase